MSSFEEIPFPVPHTGGDTLLAHSPIILSWWLDGVVADIHVLLQGKSEAERREELTHTLCLIVVEPRSELGRLIPIRGLSFKKANLLHIYPK